MKEKITVTINKKTMLWLEIEAKERNITVIQLAEELFEELVKELQAKRVLKKVS